MQRSWSNLLDWFDLLDMQLWPSPLYSRTQQDKLLLLKFQKGNNSLQMLNMDNRRRQSWVNLLDWFDLLDRQLWPYPLYSRTQLGKLLLLNFQKGNISLQMLNMDNRRRKSRLDWFYLLDIQL
jgi:hypothetical protein